jgi:quercetin dioxygenase-like cupin family protein
MQTFAIEELAHRCNPAEASAAEFLRVPAMSMSVYRIPAGAPDPQQPHTEDEAYYVVRGRAVFRAGKEERPVQPGTVLFVEANVAHRFERVTEDLELLVVFAPAKGTKGAR